MSMPLLPIQQHERRMLNRLKLKLNYHRRRYEKFKWKTYNHRWIFGAWDSRMIGRQDRAWVNAWWDDAKKNAIRDPYKKTADLQRQGLL